MWRIARTRLRWLRLIRAPAAKRSTSSMARVNAFGLTFSTICVAAVSRAGVCRFRIGRPSGWCGWASPRSSGEPPRCRASSSRASLNRDSGRYTSITADFGRPWVGPRRSTTGSAWHEPTVQRRRQPWVGRRSRGARIVSNGKLTGETASQRVRSSGRARLRGGQGRAETTDLRLVRPGGRAPQGAPHPDGQSTAQGCVNGVPAS